MLPDLFYLSLFHQEQLLSIMYYLFSSLCISGCIPSAAVQQGSGSGSTGWELRGGGQTFNFNFSMMIQDLKHFFIYILVLRGEKAQTHFQSQKMYNLKLSSWRVYDRKIEGSENFQWKIIMVNYPETKKPLDIGPFGMKWFWVFT